MPLYDYKCEKCGKVYEVRQKFNDEHLKVHEGCGGAVTRLISVPALQFKGSGFYITDYKGGKSASSGVPRHDSHSNGSGSSSNEGGSSSNGSSSSSGSSSGSESAASSSSGKSGDAKK